MFQNYCRFSLKNPEAFKNIFSKIVGPFNELKLIGGKTVAIVGSKFRVLNSKKSYNNTRKVIRHLDRIDEKFDEYMELLDSGDLFDEKQ